MRRQYVDRDSIDSALICSICNNPFINPITLITCLHTFCEDCMSGLVEITNNKCYDCLTPISKTKVFRNYFVSSCLEEYEVRCKYANCFITGKTDQIKKHEEFCYYKYNNIENSNLNKNADEHKNNVNDIPIVYNEEIENPKEIDNNEKEVKERKIQDPVNENPIIQLNYVGAEVNDSSQLEIQNQNLSVNNNVMNIPVLNENKSEVEKSPKIDNNDNNRVDENNEFSLFVNDDENNKRESQDNCNHNNLSNSSEKDNINILMINNISTLSSKNNINASDSQAIISKGKNDLVNNENSNLNPDFNNLENISNTNENFVKIEKENKDSNINILIGKSKHNKILDTLKKIPGDDKELTDTRKKKFEKSAIDAFQSLINSDNKL